MTQTSLKGLLQSSAASLAVALIPLSAMGQDAPDEIVLDEIVVTGEKYARSLRETASSVSVIDQDEVERKETDATVAEVIRNIPNLTYAANGGQGGAPTVRGQDSEGPNSGAVAFFGGTVPRMAINVDGHYLGYNDLVYGATGLWDVDSVEVFRGPQTVTQGANSIAGAVIVHTKDPTFTPEGAVQLQYGSRNKRRAAIAYSAPISDDLAARIALDYTARDNFIDYVNPAFLGDKSDLNTRMMNGRLKLLWQPADLPGFEAKLTYAHSHTNRPTWEAATPPFGDLNSMTEANPTWEVKSDSVTLDLSYEADNDMAIFSQTQYSDSDVTRTAVPEQTGSAKISEKNFSHETRVTFGNPDGDLSGVAGLFVSRTKSDETLLLRGTTVYDDLKNSIGLFSELNWRFAPDWKLTGALRYQRDQVRRQGSSTMANEILDFDETYSEWLPRLSLAYDISPTATVGIMASKGYNPGGVTLNLSSGEYVRFRPETVRSYEIFTRATFLEDRLAVNANLFYSDFKDAQRYVVTNIPENIGAAVTVNAESARSYGLELEADYRVNESLRIKAGLGLLNTRIEKFKSALADYTGNRFARAPSHTLSLGIDWAVNDKLRLSGDIRHTAGYFSDDSNDQDVRVDSYAVANAQLRYTPRDNLELFAYVDNIFDNRAPTYLRASRTVGGFEATMLEPREVGVGMNMKF